MIENATLLLMALGRTTLWLAAMGLLTAAVLRLARPNWPAAHRVAWCLVLLVGWTVMRLPVAVPWHDAPAAPQAVATKATLPARGAPLELTTLEPVESEPLSLELMPVVTEQADLAGVELIEPVQAGRPAPAWSTHWPVAVVAAWMLGMAVLLSAWLAGYARFVRSLRRRMPAGDAWNAEWTDLLKNAGAQRAIPLSVCERTGPVLCRLPRGYELFVPDGLWRELDAAGRRAILRHELAHYERGDVWKSLVVRLLALPHWFNPVSWLAVRRFDEAGEWACDRAAVSESSATDYAKLLVHLGQQPTTFGYGSAARGRTLAARVRRILAGEPKEDSTMKKALVIAIAAVLVTASVVRVNLVAKPPTENEEKDQAASPADDEKPGTPDSKEPTPTDLQPPASSLPPEAGDPSTAPPDVQQRLLEHARRAYETTEAAFNAQTTPTRVLFEWSLRWMHAAEAVATNDAERVTARRDHLERMRKIQKAVQKLHDVGTRGGEANDLAIANFYLADAERLLAEAEVPASALIATGRAAGPAEQIQTETRILDLKIKIAELRGKQQEAEAEIVAAEAALVKVSKLFEVTANNVTRDVVERARADVAKWKSQLATTAEQLKLYEEKLKLLESQPSGNGAANVQPDIKITGTFTPRGPKIVWDIDADETPIEMPVGGRRILRSDGVIAKYQVADPTLVISEILSEGQIEIRAKKAGSTTVNVWGPDDRLHQVDVRITEGSQPPRKLLYAGRDFDAWADDLRNDLSPQQRTEAIKALAAFGAHGYGPQAAEAIMEAMKDYSVWLIDISPVGELKQAAQAAFGVSWRAETATIPKDDALPVVLAALKSDSANQRLFAVTVLPNLLADQDRRLALIKPMLADADPAVRVLVAGPFIRVSPAMPQLLGVVREALEDPEHRSWAEYKVVEYVKLLDGDEPLKSEAARALDALGPAAVSGLELAARPDKVWVQDIAALERLRTNARAILEAIRAKTKPAKPDEGSDRED